MATATAVQKPKINAFIDLLNYRRDLMRTRQVEPLGRMTNISIGPAADFTPPKNPDPFVEKYGRFMDLRGHFLPLAQSLDKSQLLVMAPMLLAPGGRVGLPDVPVPEWNAPAWTEDEVLNKVPRDKAKNQAPMIPQRLTDRTSQQLIDGAETFLVFCPVVIVSFQPEIAKRILPTAWGIVFSNEPNGKAASLLVDPATGECHIIGGIYDIATEKVERNPVTPAELAAQR